MKTNMKWSRKTNFYDHSPFLHPSLQQKPLLPSVIRFPWKKNDNLHHTLSNPNNNIIPIWSRANDKHIISTKNLPTAKQNLDDNVRCELNKMLRYLNKIASQLICQFVQNALQPETNKLWTIMEAGTTQKRASERMEYCLQRDNSASQHLAKRTKQGNPCSTTACLSMCTKITKQTTYISWPPP